MNAERRIVNFQNQLATAEETNAHLVEKHLTAEQKWEARVKEYESRMKAGEERVKRERQGAKERVVELESHVKWAADWYILTVSWLFFSEHCRSRLSRLSVMALSLLISSKTINLSLQGDDIISLCIFHLASLAFMLSFCLPISLFGRFRDAVSISFPTHATAPLCY